MQALTVSILHRAPGFGLCALVTLGLSAAATTRALTDDADGETPEVDVVYLGAYSEEASDYDRLRTQFDTYRSELTECYLQALIEQDDAIDDRWDTGLLSLIVHVDDRGEVTRARTHGLRYAPPAVYACFERTAAKWAFASTGARSMLAQLDLRFARLHDGHRNPRHPRAVTVDGLASSGLDGWEGTYRTFANIEDVEACRREYLPAHASHCLNLFVDVQRDGRVSEVIVEPEEHTQLNACVRDKAQAWGFSQQAGEWTSRALEVRYSLRPDYGE